MTGERERERGPLGTQQGDSEGVWGWCGGEPNSDGLTARIFKRSQ